MLLRILLIAGILLGGGILMSRFSPQKSKLQIQEEGLVFPTVSGANLKRQEVEFPRDFGGSYNLVIIPFQQAQQRTVNTWIPFAQELEADYEGFMYYEFPTIRDMPALSRTFINEGMRAGIPDPVARERTITLYLDKAEFKSALSIQSENDISLFLVDQDGHILWRTTGAHAPDKAQELQELVERLG